jgi:hypothetical protein
MVGNDSSGLRVLNCRVDVGNTDVEPAFPAMSGQDAAADPFSNCACADSEAISGLRRRQPFRNPQVERSGDALANQCRDDRADLFDQDRCEAVAHAA